MAGRGGVRDRQSVRTRRFDGNRGMMKAPPSRHLWIGNLSQNLTEDELTCHFLEFGDLESVAFQRGRSYAFVNFKREDDAIAAMESLQGFPIAGNALRVEFTKADKSSVPSREEDYSQQNDQHSAVRGSPLLQREFRARQGTPEQFYQEKSSMGDKNTEPSEVLWIGFPATLKVDEFILRKSFAPFGEIEKITAFPGRSYAFVQFRSVISASRAKAALQGKLFGNPRVHICFARSDTNSSNSGMNSINDPPSPHVQLNGRSGLSENFRQDINFGSLTEDYSIRSQYFPTSDSGGYEPYSLKGKGENNTYEQRRPSEVSELGLSQDMYGYRGSPMREKYAHLHDYSRRFPQTNPPYEEPRDLPDNVHFFHGAKKLKTESYIPEKEYPVSVYEQERHGFPRYDFHQADNYNRNFKADPFGYKQIPERPMNLALPQVERGDPWKESYGNLQVGSQLLNTDRKRFTPEPKKCLELWKWEGTIAKGGTPVCCARCFPVGKVLDITLPEFLDCTARTGLDMLSKHYDQATSTWVVFFAPGSDADIGHYNEFMQYLGEKQRAAVAKLDDRTTLFLVPPSEFSEKVLKVPGKLSISGVVLRLDQPSSNFGSYQQQHERNDTRSYQLQHERNDTRSYHQQHERNDTRSLPFAGDPPYSKLPTPSVSIPPFTSLHDSRNSGVGNLSLLGNFSSAPAASFPGSAHDGGNGYESYNESRHEYPLHKESPGLGPNWSSHHPQNSASVTRNRPNPVSNNLVDPALQEPPSVMKRPLQEAVPTGGMPRVQNSNFQDTQPPVSLPTPLTPLQPEQLARLASLLAQQRQSGSIPNPSTGEDFRHRITVHETEDLPRTYQKFAQQNSQMTSEPTTYQFGQAQELQQTRQQVSQVHPMLQRDVQAGGGQGSQHLQNINTSEGGETEDRMQATIQLAAALLQKIQQGKGS